MDNEQTSVNALPKMKQILPWGKFYWKLIALIVSALVIAGGVALFVAGYITWNDTSEPQAAAPKEAVVSPTQEYAVVCDNELINDYNEAMFYKIRDGADDPTIDEAGVERIRSQIESSEGYQNDPSCQAILFWTAIYFTDTEAARTAYEAESAMSEKRIFPDMNIRGNQPLFVYEETLAGLESTATEE